ncbi:MAG: hypothetical protein ACH254_20950 [Candidatus Thiodiazotropha endolucinida]
MTAKIVQLIPPTQSALIRAKIQRETAVLESRRGLNAPRSARDTLINYADVLEQNAAYLADMRNADLEPVVESLIDMVARIRFWLIE